MNKINSNHLGQSFDEFLAEENMLEDITAVAHKKVLAMQIKKAMERLHMSKMQMAKKMHTSRSAVDRLLNPSNPSVTLDTIDKAAVALGMKLTISLS